jgi:GxxExxY protein
MVAPREPLSEVTSATEASAAHELRVRRVIGAFFDVYNRMGHGFLEAVYARALELELRDRGLRVEREVALEAFYKSVLVGTFRADLVVERALVIELKAAARPHPADRAQLHNYLRAGKIGSGLLLCFGTEPSFWRLTVTTQGMAPRVGRSGK